MSSSIIHDIVFLIFLLILIIGSGMVFSVHYTEGFDNLANPGLYPISHDKPILYEVYPYSGKKYTNNNSVTNVWWKNPMFSLSSYAQITNNLRYRKNPDNGRCIRSDICDVLYNDKDMLSNVAEPLPPVPETQQGVRVNYYNTNS
jgi:hypothetical protein